MGDDAAVAAAAAMANPLSPQNIASVVLQSLAPATTRAQAQSGSMTVPQPQPQQSQAQPSSASPSLSPARSLLREGAQGFSFRGIGETGEDAPVRELNDVSVLPDAWSLSGEAWSLRYTHKQSTFTFLLKAVKVLGKLFVHCLAVQEGKVYTLEVNVADHCKPDLSALMLPEISNGVDLFVILDRFKSLSDAENLLYKFRTEIVDRVLPSINKPGYEPVRVSGTPAAAASTIPSRFSRNEADERFQDLREEYMSRGGLSSGDLDLDPFAAAPGIIGGGIYGRPHPGGGMFVGPDHPMFGDNGIGSRPSFMGGPGGRPPFLPPGAVPPGARFDPIGPFGGPPGRFPGRGGRGGFGMGGRGGMGGPGGFRADPDNDEFLPPGNYEDMYG